MIRMSVKIILVYDSDTKCNKTELKRLNVTLDSEKLTIHIDTRDSLRKDSTESFQFFGQLFGSRRL